MAVSKVVVVDGNNLIVRIDRGVAGRGVTDVEPVEIDNALYLEFTFSDGTTETVGPVGVIQYVGTAPIVVSGANISLSTVPINLGGTNATTAANARTNLNAANQDTTITAGTGLSGGGSLAANRTINIANTAVTAGAYGSASNTLSATVNAQGQLTALAATPIAVANTQISGLGTMSTQNASSVAITGGSITGITDLAVADGGTGASDAAGARTNLNAANQATTITAGTGLSGGGDLSANRTIDIANTAVTAGSFGSASNTLTATVNAQGQLTALAATPIAVANTQVSGLGTMSTQNANSVAITGGSVTGITDLAVLDGGTGASDASSARTNLGAAASATTITAGTGLSGGGDLSANRTLAIANTAVTAGSFGSASNTLTATVNAQGQLTALAATPIAIANTQVSGLGTASVLNAGVALGVATLDAGGTVPLSQIPASIQGGVSYQGSWNASTNTPTLVSSVGSKGYYYVVSVAGSTNLNGITDWLPGDWAIYNGTAWEKIDNTDSVASVNGYVGAVVLNAADVGAPPTTRSISTGTGLTGGGNLSADRTISIDNTAVSAGSYGSASAVGTFTVNAQGQLTAASNTTIAIANTQVSGLGTMSTQNANSVAITGGTINGTTVGATTPSTVTGTTVTATTLVVNDNSTLGSSNSDTVTFTARVNSDIDPSTNNTYDLGRNAHAWRNLYLTGTANIAALSASGTTTLSGLTASTALALNASKQVVSVTNTGTGDNVLATSPTLVTPALGTPSSATLTNATGLPVATGISGLGSGVATFLATPSSANLAAAVTDETGTGALVFATSPTLVTPALGTPSSGVVTNLTGTASININGTVGATTASTGAFTTLTTSSDVTLSGGTANGVTYLNGSKVLTSGSALTFDGTNFASTGSLTGSTLKSIRASGSQPEVVIQQTGVASWSIYNPPSSTDLRFYNGSDLLTLNSSSLYTASGINVGIGTSSPARKLDVYGSIQAADASGIQSVLWSEAVAGGGGVGTNSNHPFAFLTNGSERMRLDSTGLGIGTTSPTQKLDVVLSSATAYSSGVTGNGLRLYNTSTTNGQYVGITFLGEPTSGNGGLATIMGTTTSSGNMDLTFSTRGSSTLAERMRVTATGDVGIGTTSPAYKLHVSNYMGLGTQASSGAGAGINMIPSSTLTNWFVGSNYVNPGAFEIIPSTAGGGSTFSTPALVLNSSGNLGIGTSSPATNLQVTNTSATTSATVTPVTVQAMTSGTAANGFGSSIEFNAEASDGTAYAQTTISSLWTDATAATRSSALTFATRTSAGAVTERARITSGGDLLVGKTASDAAVAGSELSVTGAVLTRSSGDALLVNRETTDGTAVTFRRSNTTVGTIGVTTVLTTYNTTSDYRLKNVIGAVTGYGDRLDALEPIEYEWKSNGSRTRGFLAHKFQEVYANSVTGAKDAVDAEGNPVYQAMQAGSSEIIADLVAEIQSLRARVAALESI